MLFIISTLAFLPSLLALSTANPGAKIHRQSCYTYQITKNKYINYHADNSSQQQDQQRQRRHGVDSSNVATRRSILSNLLLTSTTTSLSIFLNIPSLPANAASYQQTSPTTGTTASTSTSTTTLRLSSPQQRLGLEIADVIIGNPPRNVIAVKSILANRGSVAVSSTSSIKPGMILQNYSDTKSLLRRIKEGPYPIDLEFYNLAAGGDALDDLGGSIIAPDDALRLSSSPQRRAGVVDVGGDEEYKVTVVKRPSSSLCGMTSRRGDVLEINYDAQFQMANGRSSDEELLIVYDSSSRRGTGLPYQFVLGSGDMIPGVDLGLYDMCAGEVRKIEIPKELGYGDRGNRLFQIPGGARLSWTVELVAINSVREGDQRTRDEIEGRD